MGRVDGVFPGTASRMLRWETMKKVAASSAGSMSHFFWRPKRPPTLPEGPVAMPRTPLIDRGPNVGEDVDRSHTHQKLWLSLCVHCQSWLTIIRERIPTHVKLDPSRRDQMYVRMHDDAS